MNALVRGLICYLLILTAVPSPAADFAMKREADRLVVTAGGGEPVAAFVFADPAVGRPSIRDLAAPGGTIVTRPCPPRQGVDADDHATIHPGAWLCFSDLSGADPWRHKSAVRFVGFEGDPAVVDGAVRFTAKIEYLGTATDTPDAPVVGRERSTVSIRDCVIDGFSVRLLLWQAELSPGEHKPLVFGDTEEMGLGLRVATTLSPARGGRYMASHGGTNEKGIFGRGAAWVDASGTIDSRRVGAAVIDLAGNPREPFFHARDYGLVLANAFGRKAYGAKDPPPPITLEPGKSLRLRYAILLHGDVPDDRLTGIVAHVRDELEKAPGQKQAAAPPQHDVVVIGASPAGIAAAVAARREGRSVVLVEELSRVGGMYTAGGMGLADCFFMDRRLIDGLFEEIHGRIDAHYRRQGIAYRPANHRDRFPKDQGRWYHEPKVAEKIFQDLLAEAGVDVITGQTVAAVRKPGSRIEAVELADGRLLAGRAFVDATYTGDLMALAGVRHVVGREARAAYGESLAGKQVIHGQRKIWKVDPRDAEGRLLPTVNTDDPGPTEDGDHKIQNYNFRVTLTDDPANSVPIPPPRRYDPARYELLRRYLLAYPDDARIKDPYPLPNRKFDWNDAQSVAFSHAIPGGSWDYPAADLPTRRRIEEDHREFALGLLHFIRNDPAVPKRIRKQFAEFGLPKDEHVDGDHFPPMIYIREARRMVGEHVLTQHDIDREPRKPDSIGIGLAPITVHNVQRVALADGYYHEGSAHTPYEPHGAPYQIPYRAQLPTRAECDNLLVPVCLSASHVALGSIRVEPTWIMLGQSAGVAAALAAENRIACHDVPYDRLRERLLAGRQVLDILPEPESAQEPKP
jgi:hypothetical protein